MNYFTIKQAYYSGDFTQVLREIAKFNKTLDDTLVFYKQNSDLSLGTFQKHSGSTKLDKAFDAYKKFLDSRDISELKNEVSAEEGTSYELYLLASAQSILGDFEESLKTCVAGIDGDEILGTPELLLLAVQVALLNNQFSTASTILENYTTANEDSLTGDDELILNLAESYVKFATNQETTRSNFYYFEELSQTFSTWKTQLGLLNLHLQQGNAPEAASIIDTLESEYYSEEQKELSKLYRPHFLASKINLSILQSGQETDKLRAELAELDPDHAFIKNHKEAEIKFDEIVAKYSS